MTPEESVLAACCYSTTYHERFVLGLLNFLALKFTLLYLRNRASINQKLVAKRKLIKSAQLQFVVLGLSTCLTLIRRNRVTRQLVQLMGEPSASAVLSHWYVINYWSIDLWLTAPQALASQERNMLMPLSDTVSTTLYGCTLITALCKSLQKMQSKIHVWRCRTPSSAERVGNEMSRQSHITDHATH